jgi:REP element-mobilizing transposase RayT
VRHANCRRAFVPGGCWFFIVNLLERRQRLLVDHIALLREAVDATRRAARVISGGLGRGHRRYRRIR